MACFESTAESCVIQDISVLHIRDCHDRGTIYQSDDYFYADVVVTFDHAPSSGSLEINGNVDLSISASKLSGLNKYTFSKVKISEKRNQIYLKAYFSNERTCSEVFNVNVSNNPCWDGRFEEKSNGRNSELANSNPLHIYPNPVKDLFRVEMPLTEKGEVVIYDLLGKVVLQRTITSPTSQLDLNISNLRDGLYHLVILDGGRIRSQQFVKQ